MKEPLLCEPINTDVFRVTIAEVNIHASLGHAQTGWEQQASGFSGGMRTDDRPMPNLGTEIFGRAGRFLGPVCAMQYLPVMHLLIML